VNDGALKTLGNKLLEEFNFDLGTSEIAYRGKYRWIKSFEPHNVGEAKPQHNPIKQGGTYVITGGLGRIGYEIANHLSKKYKSNIAIITRTEIPEAMESAGAEKLSEKMASKVEKVMGLKRKGAVAVEVADVADYEQMEKAFDNIERKFGEINGVIHAAGITGKETSRAMSEITVEDFEIQFKPKVYGTYVLEQVLEKRSVDFCMLFSSLSPILGGLGYGGYAAGNSFLDGFIYQHNMNSEQPWINVNWETWIDEGKIDQSMPALGSFNAQMTMQVEEGLDVFERILTWVDSDQIVVSSGSLEQRIHRWIDLEDVKSEKSTEDYEVECAENRPQLLNEYVAPRNDIEERLCGIWRKILGMNGIGAQDDFFELGGDSLKLLNAIGGIYKEFNFDISVSDFFNNPTIEYLAKRIGSGSASTQLTIPKAEDKEHYALSSAQKRIFYLQNMDKNGTTYNETTVFILEGQLDKNKIEDAFRKLIERHEILRTSFDMIDNEPVQLIHEQTEFEVEYSETDDIDKSIRDFIRPFDLGKTPLIRIGLLKIEEEKHVMVLDMNHIITDGVSEGILIKEFMTLYNGDVIADLEIQYKDFVQWQLDDERIEEVKKQEVYWAQKFSDGIPKLELPYDFDRPLFKNFDGKSVVFSLDEKMTESLKSLSRKESVTLYMLMVSAYSVFINKVSGAEDLVIGTNSAGRGHPDTQNILGMFVNTVALRLMPEGCKKFKQYLQETKEETLKSFENQDYQFDDLVEKLVEKRDFSRNPIFDVSFVWQNMDMPDIETEGLRFVPYEYNDRSSKFDLTLMGYEIGSEILFKFEYSTDLFEESTILRFVEYFKRVLSDIVDDSDKSVSDIEVLPAEEELLLRSFNNAQCQYPREKSIVQLFEEQAIKNPDNVAVVCGTDQLSYKELNYRSNRFAKHLIKQNVQKGDIVGIMMERSLEMVVGILGILKAGGTYLPIDHNYPEKRIEYMLADSKTETLIIQKGFESYVENAELNLISFDEEAYCDIEGGNVGITMNSSDLAYIIYTSGTTGNPKGVMIEHRNVINLLLNDDVQFDFSENDVWPLFHSFCFDLSVWEMFGALLYGAKLVIVPLEITKSPKEFLKLMAREKATVLTQTPTAFSNLLKVEQQLPEIELRLRYVVFGGEALKPTTLKAFQEKYMDVKMINMYGITETTVHVTYKELTLEDMSSKVSNVGIGIPALTTYVMSKYGKLSPIGVVGELFVGGEGVGRGYLNKPELTKERFLPDPFHSEGTLYKSGDLVRWLPNGELEYLGRADNQVKIRGHRIELGEIESKLIQCEGIHEAKVITKLDKDDNNYLCAYIVGETEAKVAEMRAQLSSSLPDYMIPSYFVQLSEMPLTSNGKINVKSLPEPKITCERNQIKPTNEIERELSKIWSDVFAIEESAISIEQNFFEVGGNSINIIQISNQIEAKYGVEMPVALFFQYTTIKAMAAFIKQSQSSGEEQPQVERPSENTNNNKNAKNRLRDRKKRARG